MVTINVAPAARVVKRTEELAAKSAQGAGEGRDKDRLGIALQRKKPSEWALKGAEYFSR